jgi:hypothetical protein
MTAARLFSTSGFVVAASAILFAASSSNCGGSEGMRTGAGGSTGGSTGVSGSGGSTGAAGSGTGGRFMCTDPGTVFNCGAALTLASGQVLAFSTQEWDAMSGKYCNASGLRGSVFAYSGPPPADGGAPISSHTHGVDAPAGNFRLSLMPGPGGYAGGGIAFDSCVNASAFTGLRFSAWLASGDITGCNFKVQLQTYEQRPTSQSPAGACTGSCFGFPTSPNLTLASTPTPIIVPFANMTTSATHAMPVTGQIVGLQWQLESGAATVDGGPQPSCNVEIRIDDVAFTTTLQ